MSGSPNSFFQRVGRNVIPPYGDFYITRMKPSRRFAKGNVILNKPSGRYSQLLHPHKPALAYLQDARMRERRIELLQHFPIQLDTLLLHQAPPI